MGLIKVPLFRILPLFILSKIRQIGTLEDYIHFYITVYGNSRRFLKKLRNFLNRMEPYRFLGNLPGSSTLPITQKLLKALF